MTLLIMAGFGCPPRGKATQYRGRGCYAAVSEAATVIEILYGDIVKCCGSGVWRDQAASFWTSCSVWQRSSRTPSMNGTPARTKGSRCAPFSRRHRRCAMSKSL